MLIKKKPIINPIIVHDLERTGATMTVHVFNDSMTLQVQDPALSAYMSAGISLSPDQVALLFEQLRHAMRELIENADAAD